MKVEVIESIKVKMTSRSLFDIASVVILSDNLYRFMSISISISRYCSSSARFSFQQYGRLFLYNDDNVIMSLRPSVLS